MAVCSIKNLLFLVIVLYTTARGQCISSFKRTSNDELTLEPTKETSTTSLRRDCKDNSDCPLWGYCNNSRCLCKENLHDNYEIKCDDDNIQLSVLSCSCATYDNETRRITEGKCIQSCGSIYNMQELYFTLPYNLSELNQFMCEDKWNRTGRLCGKCLPGHAPLAYSYDMRCVSCPEGNKNVWKYILIAFGPLTVFYFIVLGFKINATSSHLHGYLYFSQTISIPLLVRDAYLLQSGPVEKLRFNLLIAFYSIWTLDILRSLHPDICLNVSTLTLFAMDYALALYPLLLTVLSYILIELHDRNYRVIVLPWKPFRFVFTLVRRKWNIRTTVIDAYATFFLLSFMKVLNTTVDILTPATATDLTSGNTTWVVYYDGTVDYFGTEHLPYAVLAIVLCTVLTIAPALLLTLYPFRWFQRLLSCLHLQRPSSANSNGFLPGLVQRRHRAWNTRLSMVCSYTSDWAIPCFMLCHVCTG